MRLRVGHRDLNGNPTEPLVSQAEFHARGEEGVLFAAGLGSGKTRAGAVNAWRDALCNPERNGLLSAPFHSTLHSVVLDTFMQYKPEGLTVRDRSNPKLCYLELPSGARIYYRTAENPASFDGFEVAWGWGDETRYWSKEAFEKFIGRVRQPPQDGRDPRWWLTSTPTMGWMHDEFNTGKRSRRIVRARTTDNKYLPASYVESLRTSYSERLQRQMIGGEFVLLAGLVYEEYDPERHLVPWTYDPSLPSFLGWDFGKRAPYVCLAQEVVQGCAAMRADRGPQPRFRPGDVVICREWVRDQISTEALAREIASEQLRIDEVFCDPAGDAGQSAFGVSDVDVLRAAGFNRLRFQTDPRLRHIPNGISLVASRLRNAKGETSLYFARELAQAVSPRSLIRAIQAYRYPEAKDGRPLSDTPIKDGVSDHAMDTIRYLCTNLDARRGVVRQFQVR